VGNGVYNATGSGQIKTVKAKVGSTVKLNVEIQNDGNDTDPITLTGPGTGNGYTCRTSTARPMCRTRSRVGPARST